MKKIILATIVGGFLAGAILVGAANAAAPGDLLYGLDRRLEALSLSLTTDPQSSNQLRQMVAQERLQEIQILAGRGDQATLDQALQSLNQEIEVAAGSGRGRSLNAGGNRPAQSQQAANQSDDDGDNEEDDDEDTNQGIYCNGGAENHHPAGDNLAEEHDVTYEEIMDWFCQGNGFGEIDLAYRISQLAGVSVTEVFDLRASGLGWGQIFQQYELNGGDVHGHGGAPEGAGPPEGHGRPDNPGGGHNNNHGH